MKIKLTKHQWERISEISGNIGVVVAGTTILPFVFETGDLLDAIRGLYISTVLWYLSIRSAKKY